MNLEHLDDPQPPPFDDARWERASAVARGRRTQRRLMQSGVIVSVVAIGIAATVIATRPDRHPRVNVAATSTSAPPHGTTALPASVWVTVTIHVDHTAVRQGDDVTGNVVFDNRRSTTVYLAGDPNGCLSKWGLVVAPRGTRPQPAWTRECAAARPTAVGHGSYTAFAPGRTTLPFHASTRVGECIMQGGSTTKDTPLCLPDNSSPPFAAGPAQLWFVTDGTVAHIQTPPRIDITITH